MSRTQQTFSQRGHANGQQTHGKMFNIANQRENANQNHNEISPQACQITMIKKNTTSVGKDVVKRKPLSTAGGNITWWGHYGKQYESSSKN